ncbi:hypothetical protein LX36DRAFT_637070 [Colletotrichum falcatum]|nr:hypothetical protein LX36DRAFT_637070 [Colletotrichum falcatum]
MQLSILKYAVVALATHCSGVLSQATPDQVVSNIKMLTDKSRALQAPAQSINVINGPLIIIGQGPFPQIILGFTDIVSTATAAIAQMQGMPPVTATASATAIFEAFRGFVSVHQALLNILIGKSGLFSTVPFIGQPIAAVLRQIESIVDTIALGLIDAVESRAKDLQGQADMLTASIDLTIERYEGISVSK